MQGSESLAALGSRLFAAWTLYLLSEYGSVKELVQAVQADRIQIVPIPFGPGGKAKATVHMAVSDASGDSAVGHARPQHPSISPTWWRSLIDHKNKVCYFDSALSPQMVWVNLNQIDFRPGSGIRAIQIEGNDAVQGYVNAQLRPSAPITFLAPKP